MSSEADEPLPEPLHGLKLVAAGFALALANFIVILDTTITNVSVPHIAGGLAISPSQGTWTITSYAVAEAITVPLTGWLTARFGTYRLMLFSLAGFAFFSFLCGIARTIEVLVLFRILQGLAGGPLMPLTQTLLMRIFPREKMGASMALWGITTISAPIIGPIVGGYISDNWSWPWIFFINLPIVALSFFLISQLVSDFETRTRKEPIDSVGLGLLVLWVGAMQLTLDLGREYDWFESPLIIGLAITAVIGFAAFLIWEWTDDHPVVDLRVLRHRTLAIGAVCMAAGFGGMFATIVLVPLWLQSVAGYTASEAGHAMALVGVFAVLMSPVAGKVMERVDLRICICFGYLWIAGTSLMRTQWTIDSSFWDFALPQLIQGFGMPFFFLGLMTFSMASVPPSETASAAGILSFIRTVAGAAGAALASSLWDSATITARSELVPTLNDAEAALQTMKQGGMTGLQPQAMLDRMVEAQAATIGISHVFWVAFMAMLLAAALIWLQPTRVSGAGGPAPGH